MLNSPRHTCVCRSVGSSDRWSEQHSWSGTWLLFCWCFVPTGSKNMVLVKWDFYSVNKNHLKHCLYSCFLLVWHERHWIYPSDDDDDDDGSVFVLFLLLLLLVDKGICYKPKTWCKVMLSATCAACGFMWLYHQAKVTTDHPWINATIFAKQSSLSSSIGALLGFNGNLCFTGVSKSISWPNITNKYQ